MQVHTIYCHNYYKGCEDGDVRLVGGDYTNEGTVEVCYDNLWGLVGDTGWTNGDAKVVCNQLGHADGSKCLNCILVYVDMIISITIQLLYQYMVHIMVNLIRPSISKTSFV